MKEEEDDAFCRDLDRCIRLLFFVCVFVFTSPPRHPRQKTITVHTTLGQKIPIPVFLGLHATQYSFPRLPKLTDYLLSNPIVPTIIHPVLFIPDGPTPPPLRIEVRKLVLPVDKNIGLCMRNEAAYRFFLTETNYNWFYRGTDDTWVSPDNLAHFVRVLSMIVNPATDIVIKGCRTRHVAYSCAPWFDGGIGWLLSRAGVMHVLEYNFVNVCSNVFANQDDTAMGVIACHTFADSRFWDSPSLPGNPYYQEEALQTSFNGSYPPCSGSDIWPVSTMVARHVHDNAAREWSMRNVKNAPRNIAYEMASNWKLCRLRDDRVGELIVTEALWRWTPIVRFRKGGQTIPWDAMDGKGPPVCRQCIPFNPVSEQRRITEWRKQGWVGFSPFNQPL
jgi:hypothetical protein